jgi:hypothetical protein
MRSVEDIAELSVARGCGFAAIGIFTFMVGLADQMAVSLKAGGIFTLGMALVLLVKAWAASSIPHKRTEVWAMMRPDERPAVDVAQQVIGATLRLTYLRFALHAAFAAFGMLAASVVVRVVQ